MFIKSRYNNSLAKNVNSVVKRLVDYHLNMLNTHNNFMIEINIFGLGVELQ